MATHGFKGFRTNEMKKGILEKGIVYAKTGGLNSSVNLEDWWEDTEDSTFGVQYKLEAEKDEARIEGLINYMEFCFILKSWRNHWRILYQKQCSQIYVLGKSLWEKCEEWTGRALG